MKREEIIKKIEDLENRRFYLAMKDFWNNEDRKLDLEMGAELRALYRELKEERA